MSLACNVTDECWDEADERGGPYAVHDPDYRESLKDFNTFVEGVTQKLIEIDDTIPELPIKDIVSPQTLDR